MSKEKPELSHYHEACELLSYSCDKQVFTIWFTNSSNERCIVEFPVHEDFLDAFLLYREQYRKHIEDRLK
jgi:hypothetical protein